MKNGILLSSLLIVVLGSAGPLVASDKPTTDKNRLSAILYRNPWILPLSGGCIGYTVPQMRMRIGKYLPKFSLGIRQDSSRTALNVERRTLLDGIRYSHQKEAAAADRFMCMQLGVGVGALAQLVITTKTEQKRKLSL